MFKTFVQEIFTEAKPSRSNKGINLRINYKEGLLHHCVVKPPGKKGDEESAGVFFDLEKDYKMALLEVLLSQPGIDINLKSGAGSEATPLIYAVKSG